MNKPKVYLTGGDSGWAIDEDLRLTRIALQDLVEFVPLSEADIVHCAWWFGLLLYKKEQLQGKKVLCHIPGEPFRYLRVPEHNDAAEFVSRWITRSQQAVAELNSIGIESDLLPYMIDTSVFRPLAVNEDASAAVKSKWNIPDNCYLIGSFQRDTEGADLVSPKLVKGPDVFLEILLGLKNRGFNFHVVLAGPRRNWILAKLREYGIGHSYCGIPMSKDDLAENTLSREDLNQLYNLIDLYVVSSRSEGGPHAVLESSASQCKIISTPVGAALDILEPSVIYRNHVEAIKLIADDIRTNRLEKTVRPHYETVQNNHRPESCKQRLEEIYSRVGELRPYKIKERPVSWSKTPGDRTTVGLWHTFFKPPYGGGNQFMMALRKAFLAKGLDVRENELTENIDAFILNSIHFEVDRFLEFSKKHRLNVLHRIDGPIFLIRGFDREKDELCYKLNDQFASATVLQSNWVYQKITELGYSPVNPVIIHNAVDADIFHKKGRVPFDPDRKIRLISSSWSNNPRKGGPIYKWIEENLDWNRFEYTFVGNASEKFDKAKHIPPVPSEDLAQILRQHDIYITASSNDPCSNALIEALACGLPALYINDGGHPELVGCGGLPFNSREEILPNLDLLAGNYESFQRLITVSKLEDTAQKYLEVVKKIIQ